MIPIAITRKYILQQNEQKISNRKLYEELNKRRGVKITLKKIGEIKNEIRNSFSKTNFNNLNKKVVFPFIGGWFFDIIDNRGKVSHVNDPDFTKGGAVFCHGNSGYIVAYPINYKNTSNLTRVYQTFKKQCESLPVLIYGKGEGRAKTNPKFVSVKYPVKHIMSDMERGWGKGFDAQITKMNANENHRFLSRINAFASYLRRRFNARGDVGNQQRYITPAEFEDFVNDWNLSYLEFNGTTRGEMLVDKNLELAYIARALYYNEDKSKDRDAALHDDDVVNIKEPDKVFNGTSKQNQVMPQKYRVVAIDNNQLYLENINNPNEKRKVHYNDVVGMYKGARDYFANQKETLKDVQIPRVSEKLGGTNVYKYEEISTAQQKKVAKTKIKKEPKAPKEKVEKEVPTVADLPNEKKNDLAQRIAIEKNYQEEQYGFPSEWRPEELYKMALKERDKLDQSTYNFIIGLDEPRKKQLSKRIREVLTEEAKKQLFSNYMPWMYQNVPKTNAYEYNPHLLTRLGNLFSF